MLKCKDLTTEAHDLIDGELGVVRRLRVRFHLLICKYCRRYYHQLLITLNTIQSDKLMDATDLEPSEAEIDRLVERLKSARED